MDRILKIENSAWSTKLTFAGIDFSTCMSAVSFTHSAEQGYPEVELRVDTGKFAEILAKTTDEDLQKAAQQIREYVEYYRECFVVKEVCRPE